MKKQSVLVTGCSHGGIGYATAVHLKELGHQVFTSARKQKDVDALNAEGFETYLIDVTEYQSIDNALENILNKTNGTLDVVFNNAGYGQAGALEDIKTKYLKEQFETNFFGLHYLTTKALKIMRKQGYGKIIQHSSVLGLVSMKYRGAYNASKYAIEGLTDTMRLELQGSNIFMTSLNTGPITSKFRENSIKTIKNINYENSAHKNDYARILVRQNKPIPFNEPALSVAKVVEKIINSNKPKPRYYITKATWIMAILKRILSTSTLDKILKKY
ncbi:short-chain dehydrogenase/reductase [Francisella halioticida]|uniref:Short-chain dehydrogenase n=1 Tax=Francisella halioticida TaxID=549298 RepID=A0ABM6LY15_9GAMM|nr:SDR family NAD(P)-dependent oxidoreductase [Francisella halioticida]ASG67454.1 short-chain dehydrogenase [Francisella halioticida]BCD89906.1 short-chain dehydrogenase/reductase [Francisella halioticida]